MKNLQKQDKLWPLNVVNVASLTRNHIDELLGRAEELLGNVEERKVVRSLEGFIVGLLFFESSTRTLLSFQSATLRLGASWISSADSSMTKGESLEDTLRVVSRYCDLIVLRQSGENTEEMATYASCPVINAGDGANEHPTQALIDLFAIKHYNKTLSGVEVGIGFDPLHSRSIRSLVRSLAKFSNNRVVIVAPDGFQMSSDEADSLRSQGLDVRLTDNKQELLGCKTVYVNRLQRERLPAHLVRPDLGEKYRLTLEDLNNSNIQFILNPLPKVDEIDPRIDLLEPATYFEQAGFGIPVRMALLEKLLLPNP